MDSTSYGRAMQGPELSTAAQNLTFGTRTRNATAPDARVMRSGECLFNSKECLFNSILFLWKHVRRQPRDLVIGKLDFTQKFKNTIEFIKNAY